MTADYSDTMHDKTTSITSEQARVLAGYKPRPARDASGLPNTQEGFVTKPNTTPGTRLEWSWAPEGCEPVSTVAEPFEVVANALRNAVRHEPMFVQFTTTHGDPILVNANHIASAWPVKSEVF